MRGHWGAAMAMQYASIRSVRVETAEGGSWTRTFRVGAVLQLCKSEGLADHERLPKLLTGSAFYFLLPLLSMRFSRPDTTCSIKGIQNGSGNRAFSYVAICAFKVNRAGW
jgi:hypothetical protein